MVPAPGMTLSCHHIKLGANLAPRSALSREQGPVVEQQLSGQVASVVRVAARQRGHMGLMCAGGANPACGLRPSLPHQATRLGLRPTARRRVAAGTAAVPVGPTWPGEEGTHPQNGGGTAEGANPFRVRSLSGLDDPDLDTRLGYTSVDEYEFNEAQGGVFAQLEAAMHLASWAYLRMALADVLVTCVNAYFGTFRINTVADMLNNLTVAAFIYFGSFEFQAIYTTAGQDLRHLMRGLWSLVNVFHEVALLGCGAACVQIATAGAMWPYTSWAIGVMVVVATAARLNMFKKPELYDAFLGFPRRVFNTLWRGPHFFIRVAVLTVRLAEHVIFKDPPAARPVLAPPTTAGARAAAEAAEEYEFNSAQEQVVRMVVRALQMVTLVRLLQSCTECLLAAVDLAHGHHMAAMSGMFQALETVMSGSLFYNCSRGLDRVQSTRGRDITNLLDGLGMQQGMGKLFSRVAHVLSIFFVVKLLMTLLPVSEALLSLYRLELGNQKLRHVWTLFAKSWQHLGLMFT